jgi:hypothetical protein
VDFSWQNNSVVARLSVRDLEAVALPARLAHGKNRSIVDGLTRVLVAVARLLIEREDITSRARLTEWTLTLAGQPFLDDSPSLLDLLNAIGDRTWTEI